MSQAEVFRIIDVLAPSEVIEEALALGREDGGTERGLGDLRKDLALVPGPPQTLVVEHIAIPEALDDRLVMLREPDSPRARSYRLLRHRLLASADPRVIAVTSAQPGEGKTTCALNLALALSEDTMTRVLLLEATLRRPALSRLLSFAPGESLVDNVTRFRVAGPPYPVAILGGTRLHIAVLPETPLAEARLDRTLFAVALSDLRTAYDYIVIDTGSVLESADADVVSECADGVVVATRAGTSRRADVRRAIAQLAPARVLGTVLLDA